MDQLTMHEWAKAQVRRAPSFVFAAVLVGGIILFSNFVRFSLGRSRAEDPISDGGLVTEEPPLIEEVKWRVRPFELPDLSKLKPDPKAPVVDDVQAVPLIDVAQKDGPITIDPPDDGVPEAPEPTDPFPRELGRTAVIGTGPGTGGFPAPFGPRRQRQKGGHIPGVPDGVTAATLNGLRWLKKAQNEDGSWDVQRWGGSQTKAVAGVSGLALFAFLGYGCNDRLPAEFAPAVRRAVEFIISRQQTGDGPERGWFGERMYEQGICTMVLSEASALLENRALREKARKAAQAGIDYILSKQPSHGAFSYTGPGTDTSVTGWQVMAIKSALMAELRVPKEALERTQRWLSINMARNGATPYQISPVVESQAGGTPRMTAVSLACRLFMGHKRTAPDCESQARFLTQDDGYVRIGERGLDFYHTYYMSLAMFQMGGECWRKWNAAFSKGLRATQLQDGPEKGSWPVDGSCYGAHGGRVYTTSMACLALEVYFLYPPMYKSFVSP